MTYEVKDRRNIELTEVHELPEGSHILFEKSLFVISENKGEAFRVEATHIGDGSVHSLAPKEKVQQVHLVIEIHLI